MAQGRGCVPRAGLWARLVAMNTKSRRVWCLVVAVVPVMLVACEKKESATSVAPEQETRATAARSSLESASAPVTPAPEAAPAPAAQDGAPVEVESFVFTLPAGWTARPASGMRLATFVAPGGVEVSVTRFPGDAGGLANNINRWRGQVFLPPVELAEIEASLSTLLEDPQVRAIDIAGPKGRILGAVIPAGEFTWFLKAQTDKPETFDALAEPFKALAGSLRKK